MPTTNAERDTQATGYHARLTRRVSFDCGLGRFYFRTGCRGGLTCDRTSNGPHILYPNPAGFGGKGEAEDPVWDNFNYDPYAKNSMIETAENVAREVGVTREEQDAVGLLRYEQYQ